MLHHPLFVARFQLCDRPNLFRLFPATFGKINYCFVNRSDETIKLNATDLLDSFGFLFLHKERRKLPHFNLSRRFRDRELSWRSCCMVFCDINTSQEDILIKVRFLQPYVFFKQIYLTSRVTRATNGNLAYHVLYRTH